MACMVLRMIEENSLEPEDPGLVQVGEWPSFHEASEHALVVLAMNLECWIIPGEGSYLLYTDPVHAPSVRRELSLYAGEKVAPREWIEPPVFPAGIGHMLAWVTALALMFLWQQWDPSLTDKLCNSSRAFIGNGEWWRPFTSLFLHADGQHLLGNVAIGGIFCVMVAQTLGAWRGWPLILLAGTIANAINAWARYPDSYLSLGASTATFGALGILVGAAMRSAWRHRSYRELRTLFAPLVVGLILLGWYGTAGENTDVAGHFAGFSVGAVLGGLAALHGAGIARAESRKTAFAG